MSCRSIEKEVRARLATKASYAIDMLKELVFRNRNSCLTTMILVYNSVVEALLYGLETTDHPMQYNQETGVLPTDVSNESLGITSEQQRIEDITSIEIAKRFGMEDSLEDTIPLLDWTLSKNERLQST